LPDGLWETSELLNSVLRRVRQRAAVVLDPGEIAGVDKAAAHPAPEIMISLTDAPPAGALAEQRPARSRLIDRHDCRHLAAPLKKVSSGSRQDPTLKGPTLKGPTLKTRP
jgi:predicted phosphatase